MKKIICIVLMLCFLVGSTILTQAETTGEQPAYVPGSDEKIDTVINLNIMKTTSEGAFYTDQTVTRGEMAEIVYRLMNYKSGIDDTPLASKQVFDDVETWNWAAGYLEFLRSSGIVNGYDDNTFRLSDNLKLTDMCRIVLYAAGFRAQLEAQGGSDSAAAALASDIGLLKSVDIKDKNALRLKDCAYILCNLLEAKVNVIDSVSKSTVEYTKGGTFLNEYMGLYTGFGVVNKTNTLSLKGGDGAAEGKIEIDCVSFSYAKTDASELFAKKVKYYCNDDDEILYITQYRSTVLEIKGEDIKSYSNKTYKYYEGEKLKSAQVYIGCDIIYNGTAIADELHFKPEYGDVTLIDNTDDGTFDVVIVQDYKNYLVVSTDPRHNTICANTADPAGVYTVINLDDYKSCTVINTNGGKLGIGDIKSDMLISCKTALPESGSAITVVVNSETVSGVVSAYSAEEKKITVAGSEFDMAAEYRTDTDFCVGDSVKLYFDCRGKAAAVEYITDEENSAWLFGYVIKVSNGSSAIDGSMEFKLLEQDGSINVLSCEQYINLDGVRNNTDNASALLLGQQDNVMRYKKSGSKITAIDISQEKDAYNLDTDGSESGSNMFYLRSKGRMQYKSNHKVFRSRGARKPDGDLLMSDKPVIFYVPETVSDQTKDSDYYTKNDVGSDTQAKIALYNIGNNKFSADVVVVYENLTGSFYNYDPTMMISGVANVMGDDEEVTYKITGITMNGDTVSLVTKIKNVFYNGYVPKKGDFVRYHQDKNGKVSIMQLVYNEQSQGTITEQVNAYYSDPSFDAEMRFIYGKATRREKTNIIFENSETKEVYNASAFKIIVYDKNMISANGTRGKVYLGTVGDIKDEHNYGSDASKIIIHTSWSAPKEIIVLN